MANEQNLKPVKPGQVLNPNGRPKGSKNWATVVRDLLMDEDFVVKVIGKDGKETTLKYPARIIADVMIRKATSGDVQAAKWLKETGWGSKLDIEMTGEVTVDNKDDRLFDYLEKMIEIAQNEPADSTGASQEAS
jgi:hypothetical protein